MLRFSFKFMAIFWILSPATFSIMRKGFDVFGLFVVTPIFNYKFDWLIFGVLSLISFIVMFLTYKRW